MSLGLLKMISTISVYKSYIFNISTNRIWHYTTYNGSYAIKPTKNVLTRVIYHKSSTDFGP